jgi:hypothetical protein
VVSQRLRNDIVSALDGGNYLHIGFQFDKCHKRTAHHGDIFGEQYPQRAHASRRNHVNLLVMPPRTGNLLSAHSLFRAARGSRGPPWGGRHKRPGGAVRQRSRGEAGALATQVLYRTHAALDHRRPAAINTTRRVPAKDPEAASTGSSVSFPVISAHVRAPASTSGYAPSGNAV